MNRKTCLLRTALSIVIALSAVASMAQEERISEECFIPSCPGHGTPTVRDIAARVKLTPNQCKVEKVCQSVLLAIREMTTASSSCNLDTVRAIQEQISSVEKQVLALRAKAKVDVLNADGRPTISQILEIELEKKLAQCEAAGLFPRWETSCLTSNCKSYLSYIDGLAVDKETCKANDGGVQGIVMKSEKFLIGQKLQAYLEKCRAANLIPSKVVKGKEVFDYELAERRAEFNKKIKDLEEPVSAGFGKNKVTLPSETFSQLMARVDSLVANPELCNEKYVKVLKKAITHYDKVFKKYPEFSKAETEQADRALARISFHAEECESFEPH